jgi:hypothetical protein
MAYFGVLLNAQFRLVNNAFPASIVLLKLTPQPSKKRTKKLASLRETGRLCDLKASTGGIQAAIVHSKISKPTRPQARNCGERATVN